MPPTLKKWEHIGFDVFVRPINTILSYSYEILFMVSSSKK